MRPDQIQAAVPQVVYAGLHSRVLFAHRGELPLRLALPVHLPEVSFLRQRVDAGQFIQKRPVRGTVEAPVEADRAEVREPRQGRPDHRHGVVGVAALPHDRVGRDEPSWSSTTQTGTTGPTGHPALPSGIHRVCGSKTGKALSPCGIVPPWSGRRSTWSICRTACDMQFRMVSIVDILTPHASSSGRVPSARSTIRRHRARHPSTSSGWARPVTRTGGNRCRTPSVRCRHWRQLPTSCFVATPAVSRTMQRTAFRSRLTSVGWRTSVFTRRESQRPVRGAPGFFRATAWPLSTIRLLTSASNSGPGSSTLSTIFRYS